MEADGKDEGMDGDPDEADDDDDDIPSSYLDGSLSCPSSILAVISAHVTVCKKGLQNRMKTIGWENILDMGVSGLVDEQSVCILCHSEHACHLMCLH